MLSVGVCANIINKRHQKNAYGTVTNPENYQNQVFDGLKTYCLSQHVRFVDGQFPPDRRSIGELNLDPADIGQIVWKRPRELVPRPFFSVDGLSRLDYGQGLIGNCWFLASIGALTCQKHFLEQVVPLEQSFEEDYCGLFHFRFWRFGRWIDVVIDDKLPTINGQLIFVHSKDPTEFWPALLEKAYAKVCGSYSDMNAGTPVEALVDFTGGIHVCINLSEAPADLWEMMCRAGQSKALMGCGTPQGETSANTVLPNGLVQGHAYTVTGVKGVIVGQGKAERLVRLQNPWGQTEWKGDWSDKSPLWQTVSPQDRELCLSVAEDGEFWMSLEDFCKFFADLDICCECPDFLDGSSSCHWKTSVYEGRWVAGTNAGGCTEFRESFWTNPQYRVTIDELSGECSATQGDRNILVSLMQKPDKRNRRLVKNLHIGFFVYEVTKESDRKGRLPAPFFNTTRYVARTEKFVNGREVMKLMWLKPGEYLIVPCSYDPNETASFILTIVSKAETHVHEASGGHHHEPMEVDKPASPKEKQALLRLPSGPSDAVNAELLQEILNKKVLQGQTKGLSIDACRSMVALLDTSLTGILSSREFVCLWNKVNTFKEIFQRADVSQTGTLSLSELQMVLAAEGMRPRDNIIKLMAIRYGCYSGQVTLTDFICMALRFDCMDNLFNRLQEGMTLSLRKSDWLYLTMYT